MKALIISGDTLQETNWNVEDILNDIPKSTKDIFEKLEFQERYLNRENYFHKQALDLTSR
jgi:dolichyl-phosphate-mannose--protein O-mannosyl transferase